MKNLKKIVVFSESFCAFFIDYFADVEWQQNNGNVVDNHNKDEFDK